jgi:hypothetical protein
LINRPSYVPKPRTEQRFSTTRQLSRQVPEDDIELKLPETWSTYAQSLLDLVGVRDADFKFYHLPLGTLDLVALANGATLHDVVPSGCRFFASWDGTTASCEMTDPKLYGLAAFRNFVQGDPVAAAFARITEAGPGPCPDRGRGASFPEHPGNPSRSPTPRR